LFIIGDSSSWTRGVGQAASSGLLAGEGVKKKLGQLKEKTTVTVA
jgi:uncharacterized FAD-dependent dehydrogenase